MQRVTNLAHETGCRILTIAHAGKRDAADDPMRIITGTNASVDDVLVLFKDGEEKAKPCAAPMTLSNRACKLSRTC
jgi:hypothetical protein